MNQTSHGNGRGRAYWRSLDEFVDTPEFREAMYREFPSGATEMLDGTARRSFLKVMGASLALAGLTLSGCRRWPEQKIVPYASRPLNRTPGDTVRYASNLERGGVGHPLLVTSYDGRPIKVDGNPDHPRIAGGTAATAGGSDLLTQASVLDLYDPDRSRGVRHNGESSDWQSFTEWAAGHFEEHRSGNGRGLAVLAESSDSPSRREMQQQFADVFPRGSWHEFEPLNNDEALRGSELAFGDAYRAHYHPDRAQVIVSLDADFLQHHPDMVRLTRRFADARRIESPDQTPCRLYSFESALSLTGANADHRVPMRSRDVAVMAARLAMELGGVSGSSDLRSLADQSISTNLDDSEFDRIVEQLRDDLDANRGSSIVMAGPRQPAEVHMLAHLLNDALGNHGETITFTRDEHPTAHVDSLRQLVDDLNAGLINTLVIIGGNPAYNAPADLDFASAMENAYEVIHLSEYVDETSAKASWHINRAHYLEAWGDVRAYDGTIGITQPLIEPLFNGATPLELLAVMVDDATKQSYEIVRRTMRNVMGVNGFEANWRQALHDGYVPVTAYRTTTPSIRTQHVGDAGRSLAEWHGRGGGTEIVFTPCAKLYDGRFANNGWLQELPDPINKLTWDNAALMSPNTARRLGVSMSGSNRDSDMVEIAMPGGRTLKAVAVIQPGQADESITVALGYGREFEGRICADAGFDTYALRVSDAMHIAGGVELSTTGERYKVASTQDHHPIDTIAGQSVQRRLTTLVREANLDEYREDRHFAAHRTYVPHRLSLWNESLPHHNHGENAQFAWGMTIDLNACTGCNACVIACQAENNIPIVGKDQVLRQREMHWLRIDRYYRGGSESSPNAVSLVPMMCVHCENAPCEQVCPVAATVHDEDGMNVMVYNRCVGTRYCSNNCPYKVRRFNYFDYHRRDPLRQTRWLHVQGDYYDREQAAAHPLHQLQRNPDVTVRMRGVMEKCTYCVQRTAGAKIKSKNEWVQTDPDQRPASWRVRDEDVQTACAEACPAGAIVFGDLKDPESEVAGRHDHHRAYEMLEELNTKPRTRYIARVRNQIPELAAPVEGSHD